MEILQKEIFVILFLGSTEPDSLDVLRCPFLVFPTLLLIH